jgi:hypothetical protein
MIKKNDSPIKKIIFVRHGTTKNEILIKEKFKKDAESIAKFIRMENNNNIYFVSSPLERCIDTGKMIIYELNKLLNTNYEINIDDELRRWTKEDEAREDSYKRGFEYRKELKKIKHSLVVVISHSSMLPCLINGAVIKKFKRPEFKKTVIGDNGKLKHGYISVVKFDKKVKYNFKC